jgi:hypothetical protein
MQWNINEMETTKGNWKRRRKEMEEEGRNGKQRRWRNSNREEINVVEPGRHRR